MLGLALGLQQHAFSGDVAAFKQQDIAHPPKLGQILFIGSSSFVKWEHLQQDFPTHPLLNRAFGGSTLLDQIYFVDKVVTPYKPKQIVIYCGENDLANDPKAEGKTVATRFRQLFGMLRGRAPKANIIYVSMKPSPSRSVLMPKFVEGNSLIKAFLNSQKNTRFVDVYPLMLDHQAQPRPELFVEDMLHMNPKGYAIWVKALEPYLAK